MQVRKRDGQSEPVSLNKISVRIQRQAAGLDHIDPQLVAERVFQGVYDGVHTYELDTLASETSAYMSTVHPNYEVLAARLAVSNLHKETKESFLDVMTDLHLFVNKINGRPSSLIADDVYQVVKNHADRIQAVIDFKRDYAYSYFGFKTLCRSYLLRLDGHIVERPQHMLMRVSIGIHMDDLESAFKTYDLMSRKIFTHASPTMFNAGTEKPQCSSCFLLSMMDDSIEGIYETLTRCAKISKSAGGIGLNVHCIRAAGSYIAGTNGFSNGLTPLLRVYNATARYVDQCFATGTTVFSADGPRPIESVQQNDVLLSAEGNMQRVERVLQYKYNGPILCINVEQGAEPVRVTELHQVLALARQGETATPHVLKNRLDRKLASCEMVDAGELRNGDWLCFPVPKLFVDEPSLSLMDCRFVGLLSASERDEQVIRIQMKSSTTFAMQYLHEHGIQHHVLMNNVVEVDSNVVPKSGIDADWINLPSDKLLACVRGVFDVSSAGEDAEGNLVLANLSKLLAETLRLMLIRCQVLSSVRANGNSFFLTIPRTHSVCKAFELENAREASSFFAHDDMLFTRIKEIKEEHYEGFVYDFEVANDHTYVTSMGAVHNGGGKRKGAFAIYLEPWHSDIFDVLELKKNTGSDELRARDLFYGLWIPDLFMKRVEENGSWSLMCPDQCPGLFDVHGEEFEKLYTRYESEGKVKKTVSAQSLWFAILESQIETGTPYMLFKDSANRKSNQKNLGTIRGSNLCTEIIEYTSKDEVAVCNLASVALNNFVRQDPPRFDHQALFDVVVQMTKNLNRIIDVNYYPIPEAKTSNLKHRPIGIGVQGLADTFFLLRFPFESKEAAQLNKEIFETIYFAACTASNDLAKRDGPYETFKGSPASQGLLQFDLWNVVPDSGRWDWQALKDSIVKHGMRNSLLVAPMPTASTAQILGNTECFEPISSNIYSRGTLAGSFTLINNYLVDDLQKLGLWNAEMKDEIVRNGGSVQAIPNIPQELKELYKTVWEIKQRSVIDMSADRGAFIDQSQSLNIHMAAPTFPKLTALHFHAWKKGLKTGMYYLRTQPAANAIQFTVEKKEQLPSGAVRKTSFGDLSYQKPEEKKDDMADGPVCTMKEGCLSCGS